MNNNINNNNNMVTYYYKKIKYCKKQSLYVTLFMFYLLMIHPKQVNCFCLIMGILAGKENS